MIGKPMTCLLIACLLTSLAFSGGCAANAQPVTIRYAAWNLGSPEAGGLERRMVEAFMRKHRNIRVEIDERFTTDYNGAMADDAAGGELPDVYMYANIPQANSNGWCADLTGFVHKDSEWNGIPEPIREAATVRGITVAIPYAIYFYGYFYNRNLFDARNVPAPAVGCSVDAFRTAVAAMTDVPNGSIGLADAADIINWYPAAANERFGWYSWDGGKLNLNSKEFVDGVKLARSITEGGQAFSALSADQKLQMQHASDFKAWNAGVAALKFDGTWAINDHAKLGFQTGFLGIPGGRACIVPDFLFLSKNSAHPAEAYAFAKFMSAYSGEGFAERLKLAKASETAVTTIPIMGDRRMINTFFEQMPMPGVREVYDSIQKGSYVEGTKVLPGYSQARWEYVTSIAVGGAPNAKIGDVLAAACTGALDIEAVAGQLNSAANECIQFFPRQADN